MSEWIRAILVMSVSGSILALLLFAIKPLIKNRLPKSAQYYLWLVVIAALLIPVSILIVLPDNNSAPIPVAPIQYVVRQTVLTAEERESLSPGYAPNADGLPVRPEMEQTLDYVSVVALLMVVYPFGAAAALLYYVIAYAVFIRKIRPGNKRAETDCPIPVYRNAKAVTPMLIGLLKPAIVLPDCDYTDAQLRVVLLHELTHLRRKDVLVKWLSVLACAIHWFNPVVWIARREIDRACELACDEAVIRDLDADGKRIYGNTLIYVAADTKTPHVVLSTTMCEDKKNLKERLGAIMKSRKYTRAAIAVSVLLIVSAVAVACALGAGGTHDNDTAEFELIDFPSPNGAYNYVIKIENQGENKVYSSYVEYTDNKKKSDEIYYLGSFVYGIWSNDSRYFADTNLHQTGLAIMSIRDVETHTFVRTTEVDQIIAELSLDNRIIWKVLPLCWSDDGKLLIYFIYDEAGGSLKEYFTVLDVNSDNVELVIENTGGIYAEIHRFDDPAMGTAVYDYNDIMQKIT